MKLISLQTDENAALNGDWIGDLPGMGDFEVFTKSLDCPAAAAYQTELARALGRKMRSRKSRDIAPEVNQYISAKTLIDICITDWKNLEVPVDAAGAVTFDPKRIVAEKALPFTKEALESILLEDAPGGKIRTQPSPGRKGETISTPDRKQARFAMRDFLSILVIAADRVAAPAEEEESADADDGGAEETEKNSSSGGSDGFATTPPIPAT